MLAYIASFWNLASNALQIPQCSHVDLIISRYKLKFTFDLCSQMNTISHKVDKFVCTSTSWAIVLAFNCFNILLVDHILKLEANAHSHNCCKITLQSYNFDVYFVGTNKKQRLGIVPSSNPKFDQLMDSPKINDSNHLLFIGQIQLFLL
jgi:hypothetical protein